MMAQVGDVWKWGGFVEVNQSGSGDSGWRYDGPPPTAPPPHLQHYPQPLPHPQQPQPAPGYPDAPSYGSGYPSYPQYPGQPQYLPGPYPMYPVPQSNGLAVAALICGLAGFFFLTSFLAIGLGVGGLAQARRTGVGRGMSISGICLGAAWLALFAGLVAIGSVNSSS